MVLSSRFGFLSQSGNSLQQLNNNINNNNLDLRSAQYEILSLSTSQTLLQLDFLFFLRALEMHQNFSRAKTFCTLCSNAHLFFYFHYTCIASEKNRRGCRQSAQYLIHAHEWVSSRRQTVAELFLLNMLTKFPFNENNVHITNSLISRWQWKPGEDRGYVKFSCANH